MKKYPMLTRVVSGFLCLSAVSSFIVILIGAINNDAMTGWQSLLMLLGMLWMGYWSGWVAYKGVDPKWY